MNALEKAIDLAGGQSGLARLLTEYRKSKSDDPDSVPVISQANVHYWIHKNIPVNVALDIEAATYSRVTRYELRPDIFGQQI